MNLSPRWVPFLDVAGIAAVHWSSVGKATAADVEIMNWARDHDYVVFTNDLDFSALLAMTRGAGPSVLQARLPDLLPEAIGNIVLRVLRAHEHALASGAIVSVTEDAIRVRVLPLGGAPD